MFAFVGAETKGSSTENGSWEKKRRTKNEGNLDTSE